MKTLITLLFLWQYCLLCIAQNPVFIDVSTQGGVNSLGSNYGVALGDFDNDGDDDIYVSKTNSEANLLFKNLGNFSFVEIGSSAGVDYSGNTYTAVWGDLDNDGYLDLYLGNKNEPNILYHNNGDGTFSNISGSANIRDNGGALSVNIGDLNNDGWLDIYVANINSQNVLYSNNQDGTFTDITLTSGATDTDIAMGSMLFDFDNDNDLDIYLSHDAKQPNKLYENMGNGTFEEVGAKTKTNVEVFGMGTEFADFNNDGLFDIYLCNLFENTLLINQGDGTFKDISSSSSTNDSGMGWGVTSLDYNNDSYTDIYIANNSYYSPHPNLIYKNNGDLSFESIAEEPTASMFAGYGVASGDLNHDGSLDIVLANSGENGGLQIFKNMSNIESKWVQVKLKGIISNLNAIGARIKVKTSYGVQVRQVAAGTGYVSQNSMTQHFGLGAVEHIDELTIYWPSGVIDVYENLEINTIHTFEEGKNTITSNETKNFKNENLIVYPNPSSSYIYFNQKVGDVWLHDLKGKRIDKLTPEGNAYLLPENLPSGYYQLKTVTNNTIAIHSISVLR